MKNTLKMIALALVASFLFTNCCKNKTGMPTYFYINGPETDKHLKLFIDDTYKGELPFINTGVTSDNDSIRNKALCLFIEDRSYKAEAKDAQNAVMVSGVIKISHSSMVSGCNGQMGVLKTPEVIVVDFRSSPEIQK